MKHAACAALALALAFTGCSGSTGAGSAARAGDGTLVVGELAEPVSLNPLMLEGTTSGMIGSILYSFLVTNDANGNLAPDVATEVPTLANGGISRDGLHVTYHLRPNIRWHDGVPLTARDCVFTYRAIMDPHNNIPDRHGYDQIADVTAPNEGTVVVRLKRPYSPIVDTFLQLNGNYPIVPEHLMGKLPDLNNLDTKRYTVGSGPFKLVEWLHGDHLTFAANDDYFRGKPGLRRLVIRIIPSSPTMLNELRTHEIDGAMSLTDPTQLKELRAIAGLRVVTTPSWGVQIVYFNAQSGPTADVAVRRALVRAIDSDLVERRATQGAYGSEHALRGLFGPYDAAPRLPTYDPAAAKAGLDAAGWTVGPDGVRMKNGQRLTLNLVYSVAQPIFRVVATQLQEELHAVGADVSLHAYSQTQFMAPAGSGGPVFGGRFDLFLGNIFSAAGPDAGSFFMCSERAPAGFNLARMCDPRFDARVERALTVYDRADNRRDVAAMESLLVEDAPQVALGQVRFISAFTDRLRDVAPTPVSPFAGVWRWSLGAGGTR
ncbi:MAG: peptide ABC transporter substrate-binding protein [Candidatus Eremiobacteraeota bacterium]|nr:peptide ABC transporter substrate-binding protein [Candidatus Eremiobacteraeota bacterium]